jgi:hypothetical protein
MFLRLLTCVLLGLAGCAKPADLPDVVVTASSSGEFTRFRAELAAKHGEARLADFDTAIQELRLDAMARNVAPAAAREADMLRAANGKTVQAVTVLGWGARKARFLREIADIEKMLARDLALPASPAVERRLGSEREVLAQLREKLAATERRLGGFQIGAKRPD